MQVLSVHSTRNSILLVVVIAAVAAGLSAISYQFSTITAAHILDISARDARSNAEIQAHDLSEVLGKQVETVANNQQIIGSATLVQNQDVEGATPLFSAAYRSTADIASSYSWLDKDGKLLWSTSFSNATLRQQFTGTDLSYRDYYIKPRETLKPYSTTLIESLDGVPRLYMGYPIIGPQTSGSGSANGRDTFKGVITSAIELNSLGKLVGAQLVPDYKSSVGLLDKNGVILYSTSSPQYIGKNVFDPELQSNIPPDIKESFNQFISESLKSKTGSGDFNSQGDTSTIAYKPVTVRGNEFAILYIVTTHELASDTISLVEQQRTLNLITVVAIGAIAIGTAASVSIWNRRLSKVVTAKTSELKFTNESLTESNRQLQATNTKLMEANKQLEVHDRLQREFVNVAAHELRTPIQPLLGAAELMESQFNEKDEIRVTRAEIEMILRNARRLERLSSDLLEISRIESGALKLNREKFSLSYIIAEAVKDAKAQSNFDSDRLSITYHPDDIFVHADREKIGQVIANLITNAIKFTKEGTISISTQRDKDGRTALVKIRDTGSGIDPEIMAKLFEKFVTRSEKGTGIGLYISKKIVEAHGGIILGENNLDGPGATFRFTIPLSEEDEDRKRVSESHVDSV